MTQIHIYEFSKKFNNIECKDGIWVSGGFEVDKYQAFFRSNYGNGNITEIPAEIRQAVAEGYFEIPNAYPPNPLTNEEFRRCVKNQQLDIAHPSLQDIALIARELENYCVLAVATRQMDDTWRSKMVGYRYFWLKTSDLNPHSPDLVDGIATLLCWWLENQKPCFDMNPDSYENSPNQNQPYSGVVKYKQEKSQQPPVTNQSNLPCFFPPNKLQKVLELHTEALHREQRKPAWAWNVRKLTKPKTFTVVSCADMPSYQQFFSQDLKPHAALPPQGYSGGTTRSQNQSQGSENSLHESLANQSNSNYSISHPDISHLKRCIDDVAQNTGKTTSLQRLIEFYKSNSMKESQFKELCSNHKNQIVNNPNQELYQSDVNYLMLINVLFWDIMQGKPKYPNSEHLNPNQTNWAIEYLHNLSASIKKYENTHKKTVSKLKQNIANLEKSLSGKNPKQNNENFIKSMSKSLANTCKQWASILSIPGEYVPEQGESRATSRSQNQSYVSENKPGEVSGTQLVLNSSSSDPDISTIKNSFEEVAKDIESRSFEQLIKFYEKYPPCSNEHTNLWRYFLCHKIANNPNQIRNADVNYIILVSVFMWDVLDQGKSKEQSSENLKDEQSSENFNDEQKKLAMTYLSSLSESIKKYEKNHNQSVNKLKENIAKLQKILSDEDPSQGNDNFLASMCKPYENIGSKNSCLLLIAPFVLLVFFSLIPLEINPLKPMINKMAGVVPPPSEPKSGQPDKEYNTEQLEKAKKFITDPSVSVTEQCENDASSANSESCQVYVQTKSKLPDWPKLPDPPRGFSEKLLTKKRENPSEIIGFLQQGLRVVGAEKVGNLGQFDETLENAVKEFQKKKCQENDYGQENDDGQVGKKTWQCLSKYVQKAQVIAVLDYQIESLNQRQQASEVQQHIEQCKSQKPKPKDFIGCVTGKELLK